MVFLLRHVPLVIACAAVVMLHSATAKLRGLTSPSNLSALLPSIIDTTQIPRQSGVHEGHIWAKNNNTNNSSSSRNNNNNNNGDSSSVNSSVNSSGYGSINRLRNSARKLIGPEHPIITHLGSNPNFILGLCQGDCDTDADCAGELICFQRGPHEAIPGCQGGEKDSTKSDYCVHPSQVMPHITFLASKPIVPLGLCEGDCDTDAECIGDLVCFQRGAYTPVPGCRGGERDGSRTDYCVLPSPQAPAPSSVPSITKSAIPSGAPSTISRVPGTNAPTLSSVPSESPTIRESSVPLGAPAVTRSDVPSRVPSPVPSIMGSARPSDAPFFIPPVTRSSVPSGVPFPAQSGELSVLPSSSPNVQDSSAPSGAPMIKNAEPQSVAPSITKNGSPSTLPSLSPNVGIGLVLSNVSSVYPSLYPSLATSSMPSERPSTSSLNVPHELSISAMPSCAPVPLPTLIPIPKNVRRVVIPKDDPNKYPLGLCQGDCDIDRDCGPHLYCFQRYVNESLPVCPGGEIDRTPTDYCVPDDRGFGPVKFFTEPFRLKLYWEYGFYWQEETFERQWCIGCRNGRCKEGDKMYTSMCDDYNHKWMFGYTLTFDQIVIKLYDPTGVKNLCWERLGNHIFLRRCDETLVEQLWYARDGMFEDYRFEISQRQYNRHCVTQRHHPKYDEEVMLEDCETTKIKSNTSYWNKF